MKILVTGGSGFIGTNVMGYFLSKGHDVLNVDEQSPLDSSQAGSWEKLSILDVGKIREVFQRFHPDVVLHLAARADCDENTTVEEGYRANTDGTKNVLDAIRATPSVKRAIITSSQFVCGPEHPPRNDEDYHPVTVYGRSKVITEQLTREAKLDCCWTLVRPTNIWGPWHQRYIKEFWRIVAKGLYVHPGGDAVIRCYGYVGNLVHYLEKIVEADPELVHEQVFYLSDPADDIYAWANAFSLALSGRPARKVARPILSALGKIGDVISGFTGKPFYITSSRYRSMTSDYLVPGAIEHTIAVLGKPPFTLEEGVKNTMSWIQQH